MHFNESFNIRFVNNNKKKTSHRPTYLLSVVDQWNCAIVIDETTVIKVAFCST